MPMVGTRLSPAASTTMFQQQPVAVRNCLVLWRRSKCASSTYSHARRHVVPGDVPQDALLALSEGTKVFIQYVTATASAICKASQRQVGRWPATGRVPPQLWIERQNFFYPGNSRRDCSGCLQASGCLPICDLLTEPDMLARSVHQPSLQLAGPHSHALCGVVMPLIDVGSFATDAFRRGCVRRLE